MLEIILTSGDFYQELMSWRWKTAMAEPTNPITQIMRIVKEAPMLS
jgi:hypothetical protein